MQTKHISPLFITNVYFLMFYFSTLSLGIIFSVDKCNSQPHSSMVGHQLDDGEKRVSALYPSSDPKWYQPCLNGTFYMPQA